MQKAWDPCGPSQGLDGALIQSFISLYRGLCRSGVLCGDRRAPSGEEPVWDLPASGADPGVLSGRGRVLPVQRSSGQDSSAEFSISTVTAVLGAPVVIAVMMKKYQRRG